MYKGKSMFGLDWPGVPIISVITPLLGSNETSNSEEDGNVKNQSRRNLQY